MTYPSDVLVWASYSLHIIILLYIKVLPLILGGARKGAAEICERSVDHRKDSLERLERLGKIQLWDHTAFWKESQGQEVQMLQWVFAIATSARITRQ